MEISSPVSTGDVTEVDGEVPKTEAELARLRAYVDQLEAQVTELRAERVALWWVAGHDELTGLANRRLFQAMAPHVLVTGVGPAAVIVLDLNGFKPINDTLGHDTGDAVLRVVAQRLASCLGDELVARLGGDEFAAVLTNTDPEGCGHWWRETVTALSAAIAAPMSVAGKTLSVSASVGVAPADGAPLAELLRRADRAMYQVKNDRRTCQRVERRPLAISGAGDAARQASRRSTSTAVRCQWEPPSDGTDAGEGFSAGS
jgi:diguanylate cyclase (GGDEF)-like protein